ncbi:MAG TPA: CapA family protein [Cyclobacteriaceae bacterium]|nr:CapA family protein [Cyclobacteriaceae bacterium]
MINFHINKIFFILFLFTSSIVAYAQDTTRLSLLFLGDIMQHGSSITAAFDPTLKKYNYDPCFQFIKPYIQSADLSIANLEVTLAGKPYSGYPQFSAPDELLVTLKDAGLDVLVTANNHCVDKGKKGLERTIAMLDSFNIPHTGTFVDETNRLNDYPLLVEKNGFKIALLNYTFSTNGLPVTKPNIVNRIDTAAIHKDLIKAKTYHADAIIVFTHWGIEYQSLPSPEQKRITEFCFNLGADLVIGAHPHVIQPMEWRKDSDKLVAYSLGNFVSGQRKRYTDGGAMLSVELQKISYTPDSTVTDIHDAGYMLQWIYKTADSNKDYYILPVQDFEKDTLGFIKDNTSRLSLKTFGKDSRTLFTTYNKNIGERKVILSSTQYFVVIAGVDSLDGKYGKEEVTTDSDGVKQVLIGPFATKDDAAEVVTTLKLIYPDKVFQIIIR